MVVTSRAGPSLGSAHYAEKDCGGEHSASDHEFFKNTCIRHDISSPFGPVE
jgi:hypothetical protein